VVLLRRCAIRWHQAGFFRWQVAIPTPGRPRRSARGFCDGIRKNQLRATGEFPVVRELAATPIDVFLVVTLSENCERNYLSRLARSVETAIGEVGRAHVCTP